MTQIKNVNIVPDGNIIRVHVSQGDIGRTLQFNLYDGALAYTPATGSTVKIQGTKPSGFGFSEACTWSGNVVTVDTTDEMTDEFGYIDTELVITSSDESEVLGTANFILAVERNPHPDNITDGTQITAQSLEVRIEALEAEMSGGGMTDAVKQALLYCFDHVAWIDDNGQNYYDALEDALYPPATLTSISAVYTQSGTVYDTDSLDDLKADLVVTAHYDNGTSQTVTSYTLSGTLTTGTSTITVTYGDKTTTFNVTVTHMPAQPIYNWDFTTSLTDTVGSVTATTNATQDSSGVTFSSNQKYILCADVYAKNRTIELDITSIAKPTNQYGRVLMISSGSNTELNGNGFVLAGTRKNGDLFRSYDTAQSANAWEDSNILINDTTDPDGSYWDNSTMGLYVDNDGYAHLYKDGTLIGSSVNIINPSTYYDDICIGSSGSDFLNTSVYTGLRIYEGNIYS